MIRKASLKDKEPLAKLYIQFWNAHPGRDPIIRLKKKPTMKGMIKWAVKDIKKRNQWVFVAEEKGKVVGFIELLIKKSHKVFKIRKHGYINSLVVDSRYRKKGMGRKLVRHAIKFYRKMGIRYIKTNVYFSNKTALKAWPRMGFRPESMFMLKRI